MVSVGGLHFNAHIDLSGVRKDIQKFANDTKNIKVGMISPRVDLGELHLLNKTLDVKQKHLKQTSDYYASHAITPKVNLIDLQSLKAALDDVKNTSVTAEVSVNTSFANGQKSEVEQKIYHYVEIISKDSTKDIVSAIDKLYKEMPKKKGTVSKAFDIGMSPIKAGFKTMFKASNTMLTSMLQGFFTNSMGGIGKSFEQALNKSMVEVYGSLNLYGEILGKATGGAIDKSIQSVDNKIESTLTKYNIEELYEEYQNFVNKIKIPTKALDKDREITKGQIQTNDNKNNKLREVGRDRDFLDTNKKLAQIKKELVANEQELNNLTVREQMLISKRENINKSIAKNELAIGGAEGRISANENADIADPFIDINDEKKYIESKKAEISSLKREYQSINETLGKIKERTSEIAEADNKNLEKVKKNLNKKRDLIVKQSERAYEKKIVEEIIKDLGIKNIDKNNLPSIKRDSKNTRNAAYDPSTNTIVLSDARYKQFKDRKLDKLEGLLSRTSIAHELSHNLQLGSGLKGAAAEHDVKTGKSGVFKTITNDIKSEELTENFLGVQVSVNDFVAKYNDNLKAIEKDAELAARRVGRKSVARLYKQDSNPQKLLNDLTQVKTKWEKTLKDDAWQVVADLSNKKGVDIEELDLSQIDKLMDIVNSQITSNLAQVNRVVNEDTNVTFKDFDKYKKINSGEFIPKLEKTIESMYNDILTKLNSDIDKIADEVLKEENRVASVVNKVTNTTENQAPYDASPDDGSAGSAVAKQPPDNGGTPGAMVKTPDNNDHNQSSMVAVGLKKVGEAALVSAKYTAMSTLEVAKFGYGLAKAGENIAFAFIPQARQMKRITQIGVPLLATGAAATAVPGLAPAMGHLMGGASELSQLALSPVIEGLAGGLGEAVTAALPGFAGGAIGGGAETLALSAGSAIAGVLPEVVAAGVAVKAGTQVIDAASRKVEEFTGSSTKAIAAGENLGNKMFSLAGKVVNLDSAIQHQKMKAAALRSQLPPAKELKALEPAIRQSKAISMAQIASQGMADQKALMDAIPKSQRMSSKEANQIASLMGEFKRQFNKAKRTLARDKIDIDDVINIKNITAQVEVMADAVETEISDIPFNIPVNNQETVNVEAVNEYKASRRARRDSGFFNFFGRGNGSGLKNNALFVSMNRSLAKFTTAREKLVERVKKATHKLKHAVGQKFSTEEKIPDRDLIEIREHVVNAKFEENNLRRLPELNFEYLGDDTDEILDKSRHHANNFEDKYADWAKKLKLPTEKIKGFKNSMKEIGDIFKKFGASTTLKFASLGIIAFGAFKLISGGVRKLVMGIKDLFFNVQKNIDSFTKLYSLSKKFQSAGMSSNAGFNIAQDQGISLQAVSSQAGITSSLKRQLGIQKSAKVAADLSKGLQAQGLQGDDLSGALLAFSQIGAKGKFYAEEGMQLKERLPAVRQLTENALGVSSTQLEEMQRNGQILAVEYLPAMAEELKRAGTAAELPTAELQRAKNNVEAIRASLGKNTLDITRPLLMAFNKISSQGTAITGIVKGAGVAIGIFGIAGVISILQLASSLKLVKASWVGFIKLIGASKMSLLTLSAAMAGITAGAVVIGVALTATFKKSQLTQNLEKVSATFDALIAKQDKLNNGGKKDRYGYDESKTGFARWFSGDLGARATNFLSFGGLRRKHESDEKIEGSKILSKAGQVYSQNLKYPEAYRKKVVEIKQLQDKLNAAKVKLFNLDNSKASLDKIIAAKQEIAAISGEISKGKRSFTDFLQGAKQVDKFIESDEFKALSEQDQKGWLDLQVQFNSKKPLIQSIQEEIAQVNKFELPFKLANASIEAMKHDLEKAFNQLEINTLQESFGTSINTAYRNQQQTYNLKAAEYDGNAIAINHQRETLDSIPDATKNQIAELLGGTDLASATMEQLAQALVKIDNAKEKLSDDIKLAVELEKEVRLKESENLKRKAELLKLESKIIASKSARQLGSALSQATSPLASVRRDAIDQKIALNNRPIDLNSTFDDRSILTAQIDRNKAGQELAILDDQLSAVNNSLGKFDSNAQQWLFNMLGDPTGKDLNNVSTEQLQALRTGNPDEIALNPERAEIFRQAEKFVALNSQKDNLRLAASNGANQIASSLKSAVRSYRDFLKSLNDQIAEAQANIEKQELANEQLRAQNEVKRSTLGATGFGRKFSELFGSLLSSLDGLANEELSIEDQRRANAKTLRDLRTRYYEINQQLQPLLQTSLDLNIKFKGLGDATEQLTTQMGSAAQNLLSGVMNAMNRQQSTQGYNGGYQDGGDQGQISGVGYTVEDMQSATGGDFLRIPEGHFEIGKFTGTVEHLEDGSQMLTVDDPREKELEAAIGGLNLLRANRAEINQAHNDKLPPGFDVVELGNISYDRYNGLHSENDANYKMESKMIAAIDKIQKDIEANPFTINMDKIRQEAVRVAKGGGVSTQPITNVPAPPQATNAAIDGLENALNKVADLKQEGIPIKFEGFVIDFEDKLSQILDNLDEKIVSLKDQAGERSKSIRNLGERFGLNVPNSIDKMQRDITESYAGQRKTIERQEKALKKEFNLNDFELGDNKSSDIATIKSKLVPGLNTNKLLEDALAKVKGRPEDEAKIRNLVNEARLGLIEPAEVIYELLNGIDTDLQLLGKDENKAKEIQKAITTRQYNDRRTNFFEGMESKSLQEKQKGLLGDGITFGLVDNQVKETKLRLEELEILKEKRDLIESIRSNKDLSMKEQEKAIAQAEQLADDKLTASKNNANPWLNTAKEGIATLKSEMASFIDGSKSLWEALGSTALSVLGKIAQQVALSALNNMGSGADGGGGSGSGFWGQLAGAAISSLNEGYIPNYADGGYAEALALSKGVNRAFKKENHPKAFLAVMNADEAVLSAKNGDAKMYARMKQNGDWARYKRGYKQGMNSVAIPSYSGGYMPSDNSVSQIANNQRTNTNNYRNNTYNYHDTGFNNSDRSNRESPAQRIRREKRMRDRYEGSDS